MLMRLFVLTGLIAIVSVACGTATDLEPTQNVAAAPGIPSEEVVVDSAQPGGTENGLQEMQAELDEAKDTLEKVEAERDELANQVARFEAEELLASLSESSDDDDAEAAEPCRVDDAVESIKDLTSRHLRFEAVYDLALSTPRMGLSRPVGDMVDTELDLLDIVDVPDCASEALDAHKAWVGVAVDGITAFMRQESDATVAGFLQASAAAKLKAVDTLEQARNQAGLPSANLRGDAEQIGTPIPTATPPPPPVEVASLGGVGQSGTNIIRLGEGLAIFAFSHDGASNFAIWLLDSVTGDRVDLLVNEIGTIAGSKAVRIPSTGSYILDVSADGAWAVIISQ